MLENCFVYPETARFHPKKEQPASYVRRSFRLEKPIRKAQLGMTSLGVYRGYLNGEELDDQLLKPGYTDYRYRLQVQQYDVTQRLHPGENIIGAVIGDGWYRGCINIGSTRNAYGTKLAWAFWLAIEYADGTTETVRSDLGCRATQDGPLRENNLKTMERYDARREMQGWNAPGYDDSAWHGVSSAEYDGEVIPQQGERVLRQERFAPKVLRAPNGQTVLDFGQNFAGMVSFTVTGSAGRTVSLTMGETLDENGNFTMKNLSAEGASFISGEVGQRLEYTLKDGRQSYEPLFQICGFRYVLLENWPEEIQAENFTGIAVYSDLPYTGSFCCSNKKLNQLVENVRWSMKSNFVDIPGDCPTRERTGWTADISVFCETACYLGDVRKFLEKWLEDYRREQGEDGNLPFVVPDSGKNGMQRGCLGWSSAIANIAVTLYRFYGDRAILEGAFDTVARFVDFNVRRAKKRNPFLFFRRFRHRDRIVETGFHYGEWLEPGSKMYRDYIRDIFYPDTEVTTAWFYQTVVQLREMAELLGKEKEAERYCVLQAELRQAYQANFLQKNGGVESKRLCRYVRPLSMGLIDSEMVNTVAAELARKCSERNHTVGTGFLTTWQLLPTLTKTGYAETAYRILENEKAPGWLYEINRGATTTWENWFGIDESGVPRDSHNHFAPGAVVAWLFSTCAGIRPQKPGFEEILIAPTPGGSLTWAEAEVETVVGRIQSRWRMENGVFTLTVQTPEGVPAVILLPDGTEHRSCGGSRSFRCEAADVNDELLALHDKRTTNVQPVAVS